MCCGMYVGVYGVDGTMGSCCAGGAAGVVGLVVDGSHRTLMQVIYPAHVIAAAAFYFARKFTHTHIEKGPDGREWWEQYGVRIEDLRGTPTPHSLSPRI